MLKSKHFVILLLIISVSMFKALEEDVFAESPSFARQEIIDDGQDWFLWKGSSNTSLINTDNGKVIEVNKTNNPSDCTRNNEFISPDIQSVSYISDGKFLNGTIWLTSPFEEPPPNDTIDIFREKLEITISKTNLNLSEYIDQNMIYVSYLFDPSLEIVENSTIISGKPAYKVVYTDKQSELKVMQLWTITVGKAYNITYSAIPSEYDDYYSSKIKHMIDTFEVGTFQREKNNEKQPDTNFLTYEDSGIRISYPVDWDWGKKENTSNELTMIVFRSPFADKELDKPSWREITYTMSIDVDSVHDAGTDYRMIISSIPINSGRGNWSMQVQEVSAYGETKPLDQIDNYTGFYNKNGSYIHFSFDLERVNSPKQYKAVFYITDYFVKNHRFCRLLDTVYWIIIPPPEFSISTTPRSVVLRPGEAKTIELEVKGNPNLDSKADLIAYNYYTNDINTDLIPSSISIPASGIGTATLSLEVNNTANLKTYVIPIGANISMPIGMINRGENPTSSTGGAIFESSNLTVTVIPSSINLSFQEVRDVLIVIWKDNKDILIVMIGIFLTPFGAWAFDKFVKKEKRKRKEQNK